FPQSAPHGV
nr:Chain C, PHE-PRO-GLN-SER-ALA-PRO-HIS-GLY-VAL [Severe acute respiratory syndrome coronavirus 2]8HSO_C Chain C, PHE-PRO-GLN-SER-ALA-PRO-HIS-GLY-VAL [Severe acute respiratory syndrome coronavirus 2]